VVTFASLIPQAELDAQAAEYWKHKFANAPAPTIVNLAAVVALDETRTFAWNGILYRVRPLTYAMGSRFMVVGEALSGLRRGDRFIDLLEVTTAVKVAKLLLHSAMRPRAPWRRLLWPLARPFRRDAAADIDSLVRWLLYVPDEAGHAPATERTVFDMVDALATFARHYPAWVGRDGLPLSWAHYVYGNRALGRAMAREDLRHASATRIAAADMKDFGRWHAEIRSAAGW
jgi:hypothetical protein